MVHPATGVIGKLLLDAAEVVLAELDDTDELILAVAQATLEKAAFHVEGEGLLQGRDIVGFEGEFDELAAVEILQRFGDLAVLVAEDDLSLDIDPSGIAAGLCRKRESVLQNLERALGWGFSD